MATDAHPPEARAPNDGGPAPVASDLHLLRSLIERERAAIRTRDSEAILHAAQQKEAILASLRRHADAGHGAAVRDGLRDLVPLLRQNLVLLAHARDCLRDAIEAVRGEAIPPVSTLSASAPLRPGMRISVVG